MSGKTSGRVSICVEKVGCFLGGGIVGNRLEDGGIPVVGGGEGGRLFRLYHVDNECGFF